MQKLKKLPIYVREFGFFSGLRIFLTVEWATHRSLSKKLHISAPNYSGKIYLRDTVADCSTFWQCLVQRQYDIRRFPQHKRLMEIYEELLSLGQTPTIIDCGGNIGLSSIWFAQNFPKAKIISIEPDENNFEMLQLNTSHLADRIILVKGGIWNKKGALKITNPSSGAAAFRVDYCETSSPGAIPAFTIDDLCSQCGTTTPLIVKLDIEGAQSHLFSSNTEWVNRTMLITLELDDWLLPWQGTSRNFFACISKYPFDYLLGGESIFCFRDTIQSLSEQDVISG